MATTRRWLAGGATLLVLVVALAVVIYVAQRPSEQTVESYRVTSDASSITARVTTGRGDQVVKSFATETADEVAVSVLVRRSSGGSSTAEGYPKDVTIRLDQPLGSRSVVDAKSGLQVIERQGR
jgi:Tfp pilus assembly protein FimT